MKVYNGTNTTFLLVAEDGAQMKVPFKGFAEVADKFQGDITFRMAMKSGAFTVFDTAKQGDVAERKSHEMNTRRKSEKTDGASEPSDPAGTSAENDKGDTK